MKSKILKLICAFLCLVLIATVGFAPMGAYAQEETDMSETNEPKPLKILAIGNSYTNNATQYISKIAESMGLEIKAASPGSIDTPIATYCPMPESAGIPMMSSIS